MRNPLIFTLGVVFAAFGVATIFIDLPFQSKIASFVEGCSLGLGLAMMMIGFVKRKQERDTQG
jgi:hypothetical protein